MKHLTLLLLSLLCTCVCAQKSTAITMMGSGSMIVELGDGTWDISLSTAAQHKTYKFVSEAYYRKNPRAFIGYEIIKSSDRYDLSVVHKIIDQQLAAGWKLISAKHSISAAVMDYNELIRPEILHYAFSVPIGVSDIAEVKRKGTMVLAAEVVGFDAQRFRGGLLKQADSTYTLLIEERVGTVWLEHYRLNNSGITAGDSPSLVESIIIEKGKLTFVVSLMTGRYHYNFEFGPNSRYYFNGLQLQTNKECGIQELTIKLSASSLSGRYLSEQCFPGEKKQSFREFVKGKRIFLSDFIPGTRRIDLEKPAATVFY